MQTVGLKKKRLVIVNLQNTPLDRLATLRVYAKCDDFTKLFMQKLELDIPQFRLKRRILFKTVANKVNHATTVSPPKNSSNNNNNNNKINKTSCRQHSISELSVMDLQLVLYGIHFRFTFTILQVIVEQVDAEGNPFSYLKHLEFKGAVSKSCDPGKDPLECPMPARGGEVIVQLVFQAHYGEPDVSLPFRVSPGKGKPEGEVWGTGCGLAGGGVVN